MKVKNAKEESNHEPEQDRIAQLEQELLRLHEDVKAYREQVDEAKREASTWMVSFLEGVKSGAYSHFRSMETRLAEGLKQIADATIYESKLVEQSKCSGKEFVCLLNQGWRYCTSTYEEKNGVWISFYVFQRPSGKAINASKPTFKKRR